MMYDVKVGNIGNFSTSEETVAWRAYHALKVAFPDQHVVLVKSNVDTDDIDIVADGNE